MMESFSCPAKVTGNFLPGTDDPDTYDPVALNGSFNASSMDETPQDEYDLGIGNGITVPIIGQRWYNTTDKTLYTYVEEGSPAGVWQSAMTATGILDMAGYTIINMPDPFDAATTLPGSITQPQDVVTVGWADDRFVNETGDTMTGDLTVPALTVTSTNGFLWENGRSRITHNDGGGNSNIRFGHEFNVNEIFTADNSGAARIRCDIDSEQADLKFAVANNTGVTNGDTVTWGTEFLVGHDYLTWGGDDLATEPWADGKFVPLELDSTINSTGSKTLTIRNSNLAQIETGTLTGGGLVIGQAGSGYDAFITFDENGSFFNLGRDGATNDLYIGGGSFGATKYKVWHQGNDGPGSGLNADYLDNYTSGSFLKTTDGYKRVVHRSPYLIHYRSVDSAVSGSNYDSTQTISYSSVVPSWANYVLIRTRMQSEYITDMRWMFSQLNNHMVCGMGSDDTDQSGQQFGYTVSETWVQKSHTSYRWHYLSHRYQKLWVWVVGYSQ
jgi:plastocyanin